MSLPDLECADCGCRGPVPECPACGGTDMREMEETDMKPELTWEEIDACESPDEIAALLRQHKVKGIPTEPEACPLAIATDWRVYETVRVDRLDKNIERRLTSAELEFIERFDNNGYPDLIEKVGE